MQPPMPPQRRRTILIDREFQLRFIGRLAGVLVFYLLLFLVISVAAPVAFTFLGDPPEWAVMETAFRVEVLLRLILAPLACTFVCLFAHGALETFKIAGPNFRFKAVFRDLARLRLPRGVRIRAADYLHDTERELDRALFALHEHVKGLRSDAAQAKAHVAQALAGVDGEVAHAARAAVDRLEAGLARYELVTPAPACQPIADEEQPVEPLADATTAAR